MSLKNKFKSGDKVFISNLEHTRYLQPAVVIKTDNSKYHLIETANHAIFIEIIKDKYKLFVYTNYLVPENLRVFI